MEVDTESVAVLVSLNARPTEVGVKVDVAPDGRPEVTERLTVPPPYVLEAVKESVYEAEAPAPTLCEVGEALIVKSLGGGGGGPVE
jgi:hypothetical protein